MSNVPPSLDRLMIRTIAMPKDTNPNGDIFGGWILSQMDLAGASAAKKCTGERVVTVAIKGLEFYHPVGIGDEVSCYAHVTRIGRSSITVAVDTWVERCQFNQEAFKVTEGIFTFVAIDQDNKPKPIPEEVKKNFEENLLA